MSQLGRFSAPQLPPTPVQTDVKAGTLEIGGTVETDDVGRKVHWRPWFAWNG